MHLRALHLAQGGMEVVSFNFNTMMCSMKYVIMFVSSLIALYGFADEESDSISTAIDTGNATRVREVEKKSQINEVDESGRTSLMLAARQGNLVVVKKQLLEGADIEIRDKYGFTVIDQLESILRRTGPALKATIESMRKQGFSEDTISKLVASSAVPGNPTEKELEGIKTVLTYLKKVKVAQEN